MRETKQAAKLGVKDEESGATAVTLEGVRFELGGSRKQDLLQTTLANI